MTTLLVHRVLLDEYSDMREAEMLTCFLNAGNEVLRIGPDDRVDPWKEIERVAAETGGDEVVIVRKCLD